MSGSKTIYPIRIITVKKIEALAVEHEDFGFGKVDAHGYTTHGFNPKGLRSFIKAIIKILSENSKDQYQEGLNAAIKVLTSTAEDFEQIAARIRQKQHRTNTEQRECEDFEMRARLLRGQVLNIEGLDPKS